MSAKPKTIQPLVITRKRKTIKIHYKQGEGTFDLDEPDNPLPAFTRAFDALPPLVCEILHVGDEWAKTVRVVGVRMSEKGGADEVQLVCRRDMDDASKEFAFTTPPRLLANPTEPGKYSPPLSKDRAELIYEVLEQGKNYIKGKRAQGTIDFEGGEDDDDEGEQDADTSPDNIEPLPGMEQAPDDPAKPSQKPPRKRKRRSER